MFTIALLHQYLTMEDRKFTRRELPANVARDVTILRRFWL